MARNLKLKLTPAQISALGWATRLTDGIQPRTQACPYTQTMRRLEDYGLVEVVERNGRGDPLRAKVTGRGLLLAAELGVNAGQAGA